MEKRRITLMMAVGRTHHIWEQRNRMLALQLGIPDSYVKIIMFLTRHPGANQKNIAEFSNITTPAVNQTVKEMLREGYLEKETDENDERHSRLYLTQKSNDVAQKLIGALHASDDRITRALSEEKEAEMVALLDRIHDLIREELYPC